MSACITICLVKISAHFFALTLGTYGKVVKCEDLKYNKTHVAIKLVSLRCVHVVFEFIKCVGVFGRVRLLYICSCVCKPVSMLACVCACVRAYSPNGALSMCCDCFTGTVRAAFVLSISKKRN